jgi:hypothetical protein
MSHKPRWTLLAFVKDHQAWLDFLDGYHTARGREPRRERSVTPTISSTDTRAKSRRVSFPLPIPDDD